jgi:phage terminase large subunit
MDSLERCLTVAKEAGVPKDQAQRFVEHGYVPLPWQWQFHAQARLADKEDGPVDIGLGGARGPGKSHGVISQAGLDDCQRVAGLKGLFLRQTGLAAKESFDDLIDKALRGRVKYTRSGQLLRFDNNSKIILGGFKDQNDIDKYIGIEYDFIIVEELNQLTEEKYTKLRGSLRTSKPNWRPRMYTSFNPGGIGHKFVRSRYVIPFREKSEKETRFIPSTYKENPYLNKEYIQYLESLVGDLGRAWREGEWDLFEGMFFDDFHYNTHVMKRFTPPDKIAKYGGMDWGRAKPFCFLATAIVKEKYNEIDFNRAITYAEVYGTKRLPEEWAATIKLRVPIDKFEWVRGDPAMFKKGDDGSTSIADQFNMAGIYVQPANNDRLAGWELMHKWLSIAPDGLPYWLITENCVNLIRTIPEQIYDENKAEDLDTDGEDHSEDCQRYIFKHLRWIDAKVGTTHKAKVSKPRLHVKRPLMRVDLDAWATGVRKAKRDWGV